MHGDTPGGPIRWRMFIPVSPDRVYQALATDAGRTTYWAESTHEDSGEVRFVFANGSEHRAKVIERIPPKRFSLMYFHAMTSFQLTPTEDGGTDLLLTHEGIHADDWHEVHAGWLNVLFPLKAMLAFGVDLRNHSRLRSWDQGYADQ
jgi:uncharacterized protein YndB with AHSA1/START domain